MAIFYDERKRIEKLLFDNRSYFKRDENSEDLIITFESSERELKTAKRIVAKKFHPDLMAQKKLSEAEVAKQMEIFKKLMIALDTILKYQKDEKEKAAQDRAQREQEKTKNNINKFLVKFAQMRNNNLLNYYELFDIDQSKESQEILQSEEYQILSSTLNLINLKIVDSSNKELFEKLVKVFEDFDRRILKNKEGRFYYDELLRKEQENSKKSDSKMKIIEETIKKYNQMTENKVFNYYELFDFDQSLSRINLLNSSKAEEMSRIFTEENANNYNFDQKNKTIFIGLCKIFNLFINSCLSSDIKKREYDDSLLKYNNQKYKNYRYIYEERKVDINETLSELLSGIFGVIEKSLRTKGATNAVIELAQFMDDFLKTEKSPVTVEELKQRYKENDTLIIASCVMDEFFSRKIQVLSGAVTNTVDRYNVEQAVRAIYEYTINSDPDFFTGNHGKIGREKLIVEIKPELMKFILAAKDRNKSLLIDFPEYLIKEYNNEQSINEVVGEFIKVKSSSFTQ